MQLTQAYGKLGQIRQRYKPNRVADCTIKTSCSIETGVFESAGLPATNLVAKSANQINVKAKFNYIPPISGSSLAVRKSTDMKPQATHQEILLLSNTGLLKRQLCLNNNDPDSKKILSPIEQLEKACWDGLLAEILPGVILNPATDYGSFVWEVFTMQKFIHISLGPHPSTKNRNASIDPCYFYQSLSLN